jgi:ribonucleoside-diphosphate reductase beta chain
MHIMSTTLQQQKMFDYTKSNMPTKIVGGESSGILNWDMIRIPELYKLYKVLLANHWIADEIKMGKDKTQFEELTEAEKTAFEKIISLLSVLDSMQTRFVAKTADYFTDAACEACAMIIGQQEVVHNQSYTYVLSSLVNKQKQNEIFEYWKHDPVLLERNLFISEVYQEFADNPTPETFLSAVENDMILEGLFFYAGFAFFYNLARRGLMLGTSQMISYIQRDENQHCHFFGLVYQQMLKDYPELDTKENLERLYKKFTKAVELEIKWAKHLLGDVEGIDLDDFANYIKHMANRRLQMLGREPLYENVHNALPWIRPFSDESLNKTKTDFFESKPRTYAKTTADNGMDDL